MTQSPKEPKTRGKLTKREQLSSSLLLKLSSQALAAQFYALENPRDIANLLNISYRHLVHHIYVTPKSSRYKTFKIPKRSGGVREISTPITPIKIVQWRLNQVLQAVYKPKPSVHGFIPGKNIVTNAQAHSDKRYVLNLDLKDFFPSINFGRVRGMFIGIPYNLNPDVATVLAQICCHNSQLPQGAPTSPMITNMLCAKMDSQFQRLAKACRATYTRYADDITFSTTRTKFPPSLARVVIEGKGEKVILGEPLLETIEQNGFKVNRQKIRLQTYKHHQEVTGLTVNQFPNVDRRFVRQVRAMLHAWAKYGLEVAEKEHREKHATEGKFPGKNQPTFKQVLRGKIEFIGMVKGKDEKIYQKFLEKYLLLSSNTFSINTQKNMANRKQVPATYNFITNLLQRAKNGDKTAAAVLTTIPRQLACMGLPSTDPNTGEKKPPLSKFTISAQDMADQQDGGKGLVRILIQEPKIIEAQVDADGNVTVPEALEFKLRIAGILDVTTGELVPRDPSKRSQSLEDGQAWLPGFNSTKTRITLSDAKNPKHPITEELYQQLKAVAPFHDDDNERVSSTQRPTNWLTPMSANDGYFRFLMKTSQNPFTKKTVVSIYAIDFQGLTVAGSNTGGGALDTFDTSDGEDYAGVDLAPVNLDFEPNYASLRVDLTPDEVPACDTYGGAF